MRARWHEFLLALVFLTRLPLGRLLPARILPLSGAMWAFPLAGALVGAVAGLPLLWSSGPPLLLAALSVALAVALTGALHEDALADFTDAAGGRDRDQRLRIMRDSHIGSFGVMALLLSTALRIAAVSVLGPAHLIAAAASGRAAMVAATRLPASRGDGLGRAAGRVGNGGLAIALLLALLALMLAGKGWLWAAMAGVLAAWLAALQARRWIGGQSGDVLGACGLLCETAILCAFALAT